MLYRLLTSMNSYQLREPRWTLRKDGAQASSAFAEVGFFQSAFHGIHLAENEMQKA